MIEQKIAAPATHASSGRKPEASGEGNDPVAGAAVVSFVVHGIARPAGSKTTGVSNSGRRFVRDSGGRNLADWRRAVTEIAGDVMSGPLLAGPLELLVVFYLPRPVGHYGKRGLRPSVLAYPATRPDATKLLRAVEDAMRGIVYRDDGQIVSQHVYKKFGEPARAEVTVSTLELPNPKKL